MREFKSVIFTVNAIDCGAGTVDQLSDWLRKCEIRQRYMTYHKITIIVSLTRPRVASENSKKGVISSLEAKSCVSSPVWAHRFKCQGHIRVRHVPSGSAIIIASRILCRSVSAPHVQSIGSSLLVCTGSKAILLQSVPNVFPISPLFVLQTSCIDHLMINVFVLLILRRLSVLRQFVAYSSRDKMCNGFASHLTNNSPHIFD